MRRYADSGPLSAVLNRVQDDVERCRLAIAECDSQIARGEEPAPWSKKRAVALVNLADLNEQFEGLLNLRNKLLSNYYELICSEYEPESLRRRWRQKWGADCDVVAEAQFESAIHDHEDWLFELEMTDDDDEDRKTDLAVQVQILRWRLDSLISPSFPHQVEERRNDAIERIKRKLFGS